MLVALEQIDVTSWIFADKEMWSERDTAKLQPLRDSHGFWESSSYSLVSDCSAIPVYLPDGIGSWKCMWTHTHIFQGLYSYWIRTHPNDLILT